MSETKAQPVESKFTMVSSYDRAYFRKHGGFLGAEGIRLWLFNTPAEQAVAPPVSYSAHGPGQILKLAALRGSEEIFVEQQAPVSATRKKILISNGFMKCRAPLKGELAMMAALIERSGHEVYLWEGPKNNLATAPKVTSAEEFWRIKDRIQPATAEEITSFFDNPENQYLSADWLILDLAAEQERWGVPQHRLHLHAWEISKPEDREILLQSINPNAITCVDISCPDADDIRFLMNKFPQLNTLIVHGLSLEELQALLPCFENSPKLNLVYDGSPFEHFYGDDKHEVLVTVDKFSNDKITITLPVKCNLKSIKLCGDLQKPVKFVRPAEARADSPIVIQTQSKKIPLSPGSSTDYFTYFDVFNKFKETSAFDMIWTSETHIYSFEYLEKLRASPEAKKVERLLIDLRDSVTDGEKFWGWKELLKLPRIFPKLKSLSVYLSKRGLTNPNLGIPFTDFKLLENFEFSMDPNEMLRLHLEYCPRLGAVTTRGISVYFNSLPAVRFVDISAAESTSYLAILRQAPEIETLHYSAEKSFEMYIEGDSSKIKLLNLKNVIKVATNSSLKGLRIGDTQDKTKAVYKGQAVKNKIFDLDDPTLQIVSTRKPDSKQSQELIINLPEVFTADNSSNHKTKPRQAITGMSYYNVYDKRNVRAVTEKKKVANGVGEFKSALLSAGKVVKVRDYCVEHYDGITLENEMLEFHSVSTKFLEGAFSEILLSAENTVSHEDEGLFEGRLQYGKNYPLTLSGPVEEKALCFTQISSTPNAKIGSYYDPNTKHYFVRLLPPEKSSSTKVTLQYAFTPNKSYNRGTNELNPAKLEHGLPDNIRNEVEIAFKNYAPLGFLFDESSVLTKIQNLEKFFQKFEDKPLNDPVPKEGSWKEMQALILQQKGVCEQRSQAFMLLSRYIDVDVMMICNEVHARCKIKDKDGNWVRVDLGGGELTDAAASKRLAHPFMQRPPKARPIAAFSVLDQTLSPTEFKAGEIRTLVAESKVEVESPASFVVPEQKITISRAVLEQKYGEAMRSHFDTQEVFDFTMLNDPALTQPILIDVAKKEDVPEALRYCIANRKSEHNFLVIQKFADFKRYQVEGLLNELAQKGSDLYINLLNFNQNDLDQIEGLFASPPRFDNKDFAKVRIVGFMSGGRLKNCRRCTLPPEAFQAVSRDSKSSASDKEIVHIDLFCGADWEEQLVADVIFTAEGAKLDEKPLLTTKNPLVIHRPPADPEFWRRYEQIKIEGRIFYNEEWRAINPALVSVDNEPSPQSKENAKKALPFTCLPCAATPEGEQILLWRNLWYTLYEQTVIRDKKPITEPGKLDEAAKSKSKMVFYVTEQVSSAEWDRLAEFIRIKYPKCSKDQFVFQLAPGVTNSLIPKNDAEVVRESKTPAVSEFKNKQPSTSASFTSNDPAYLAELLCAGCHPDDKAQIIDLTPTMGEAELIARSWKLPPDETKSAAPGAKNPRFDILKGKLLQELEAGHTVILQGGIPPGLRQVLLPLFSKKPYLEYNGERIPIPGKLWVVEPKTASANPVKLSPNFIRDFSANEYEAALLEGVAEKDRAKIKNLFVFFKAAAFPHSGSSMPKDTGMCWERLRQMKALLLSEAPYLHKHNPIKGLMLNDYAKDSEYRAFLNVVGKFLFDSEPKAAMRLQKYESFLKRAGEHQQAYAWRLINTLNGDDLREILGKDWLSSIDDKPLFQSMTPAVWSSIYAKLQEKAKKTQSAAPPKEEEKSVHIIQRHYEKVRRNVSELSKKKNVKVIVLKGDPGVGKTHLLCQLGKDEDYDCFSGLAAMEDFFAKATSEKPRRLFLDEINTEALDSLNFITGINRDPPVIFYKGKFRTLGPDDEIIAAINYEHVQGRFYHPQLRNAHNEHVRLEDLDVLERFLCDQYRVTQEIAKKVVAAAELFKSYRPITSYSYRHLQNVMQRYMALAGKDVDISDTELPILYRALLGEFGISIPDPQFKSKLLEIVGCAADDQVLFPLSTTFCVAEMQDAQEALIQGLLIRQNIIQTHKDKKLSPEDPLLAHKRGILLQGSAGIGKQYLCRAILQEAGFSLTPKEDQHKYFEVAANAENFRDIAKQAFIAGAPLLIRNLNRLKLADDKFLGALLMGIDPETGKQAPPGFFAVCCQHPNSENKGVRALSSALCNRMHVVQIPKFSDESWLLLAEQTLGTRKKAEIFVKQFELQHSQKPTGHDFFACLNNAAQIVPPEVDVNEQVEAPPVLSQPPHQSDVNNEVKVAPVLPQPKKISFPTVESQQNPASIEPLKGDEISSNQSDAKKSPSTFSQRFFAIMDKSSKPAVFCAPLLVGTLIPAAMYGGFLALQQAGAFSSHLRDRVIFHSIGAWNSIAIGALTGLVLGLLLLLVKNRRVESLESQTGHVFTSQIDCN